MLLTAPDLARLIDLSSVRAECDENEIRELATTALHLGVVCVFTLPCYTRLIAGLLADAPHIGIGGVVGFPSGAHVTSIKVAEARQLLADGATELDMVINIGQLRSGNEQAVSDDIRAVVAAAGNVPVKVILECHWLSADQIRRASQLCVEAGAAWVKTATGWAPTGATLENLTIMRDAVAGRAGLKAAGGVRDLDTLVAMYRLGVRRFGIGTANGIRILDDCASRPGGGVEIPDSNMSSSIIAYDLGTGGIKASLYQTDGLRLASVFVGYETRYPQASWHEQRPADWWSVLVAATRQLLGKPGAHAASIRCLAISGHSLGCVPLDRDGQLLADATPIWSDRRAEAQTVPFFAQVDPAQWYRTTGNGFPPAHYTVFKVLWYRDHQPELFRKIHQIVGTKDYLNFCLTGVIRSDFSYASGCGVYDLTAWDYAPALVAASGLPREIWPDLVPSASILGPLTAAAAGELGLPPSVLVACGGVDNSCMALGAGNIAEGRTYASLGSSAWIAVTAAHPLLDERVKPYVFTHVMPGLYNSAVAIFASGSSFKWVCQQICQDLIEQAGQRENLDVYDLMSGLAASSPPGARGVLFNPSLAGGSSLDLSPLIRGAWLGLDLGHTRADLLRATMEGIALNLRLALDELRHLCPVRDQMVVVGGSSKSTLWRQIFADAFELSIHQTQVGQDAGSLGAAAVAAVAAGLWSDFSPIDTIHQITAAAAPDPANVPVYQAMLPAFRRAARHLAESAIAG